MELPSILKDLKLKPLFWSLLCLQLIVMLIMSLDVGISADENRHYIQAEKVYNFYKSRGEDKSALENTGIDPMQFNGQSFDNAMFALEKLLNIEKSMEMRHFFNALIGWLVILFTGLIARDLWGYKGAIIAILFLFISPRFIGHALNNNKDIPFAFGFIASFYGTLRFIRELPKPKFTTLAITTLGIAMAISIRLAGLLSIAFLGLFSSIHYFSRKPVLAFLRKNKVVLFKRLLILIPLISAVGYFLGILFWPFMLSDPLKNIKAVLEATSTHPVSLNQLFKGEIVLSNTIPNDYCLTYILISYPLVILAGLTLFAAFLPFNVKRKDWFDQFALLTVFSFVVVWMSIKNSNLYGGIRHLLFIYPIAVLMAVLGFKYLTLFFNKYKSKWVNRIPVGLVIILCLFPLVHLAKNYPYSYVYFNELAGGVKNSYDKYETDYFQHSLKHATEWFVENELPKIQKDSGVIKIVTNDGFNTGYYLKGLEDKIQLDYTRYYEKYQKDWDYAIFYCGYIHPHQISTGLWPPNGTIHTEEVDGFPVGVVVKRVSKEDYNGFQALNRQQTKEAKELFNNFINSNSGNEEIYEWYARTCLREGQLDSTIFYANKSLEYNPRHIGSVYLKAAAHNARKEYQEALAASNEGIAIKEAFAEIHYQKAIALRHLGDPNGALKEFSIANAHKDDYYQSFMQMGDILVNYSDYSKAINMYNEILKFKPDDMFATIYLAKCHHFLKQQEKAEELLNTISQSGRRNLEWVKTKFRIELEKGNLNEAAQLLNMARFIQNNSELFVLRARFELRVSQNKQKAKELLDKAIELDNLNREAKELVKLVEAKPAQTETSTDKQRQSQQSIMFQNNQKRQTNPLQPRRR